MSLNTPEIPKLDPPRRWLVRAAVLVGLCWIFMVALPSFELVRGWLSLPLYVNHDNARGEVAYVMADGFAYYERLRAAADLYHMRRIEAIYITDERQSAGYDFVEHRSQTRAEQAIGYLGHLGVRQEKIYLIPAQKGAALGSLSEARSFASLHGEQFARMVVVTSAPHTRRSLMCFRRSLPEQVTVQVYAASLPAQSAEVYMPIWQEYLKLLVYFVLAARH